MSRAADSAFPEVTDEFDPPLYTDAELEFIRDNLGTTSYIALQMEMEDQKSNALKVAQGEDAAAMSRSVRAGKAMRQDRPSAVRTFERNTGNALQRFHELEEIAKHRGQEWEVFNPVEKRSRAGYEGIRVHIDRWLRRQELFLERKHADPQLKGFHPEMWTIRDGAPVWSGRGTQSGRVRYPLVLVPMGARSYEDFTQEAYGMGAEDNGTDPIEHKQDPPEYFEGEAPTLESIRTERGFPCPIDGCDYVSDFDPDSEMDVNRAEHGLRVHMGKPKGKFKVEEHRDMKERIFA